jgi:hypothetical protein
MSFFPGGRTLKQNREGGARCKSLGTSDMACILSMEGGVYRASIMDIGSRVYMASSSGMDEVVDIGSIMGYIEASV